MTTFILQAETYNHEPVLFKRFCKFKCHIFPFDSSGSTGKRIIHQVVELNNIIPFSPLSFEESQY